MNPMEITVRRIDRLSEEEIERLVEASLEEGYRHIKRLTDDYREGKNRFDKPGEALFGAFRGKEWVGICGLNQDPYTEGDAIGRIRRMYVLPEYRRYGIGRLLMRAVLGEAEMHFHAVALRTDNPVADRFYRSLGFLNEPLYPESSHYKVLRTKLFS